MTCVSEKKRNVNTKYKRLNYNMTDGTKHMTRYKGLQPYVLKQFKMALCLTIGNLTIGYSIGWSAPVTSKLKDVLRTPLPYVLLDKDMSWVTSALVIGAIIGSNVFGYIANKIGRKPSLLLVSSFNLVGYIVLANAGSVTSLLVGRAMVGSAAGAIALLNVVYLGEIASPNIRGSLTALTGILQVAGSLLVCSIGPYMTLGAVSYMGLCVSCVHTMVLCAIVESPVYHVMKGNLVEAKLTLHNLGRTEDIDEELKLITESVTETLLPQTEDSNSRETQKRWRELVFKKKNRMAFLITTFLFCLQIGGGVTTVISFAMTIFKNEQSSVDPNVGTIILGLTELCGVILTPLLIERCGRRILLLISFGCCCLCMGVLGTYFYLEVNHYMMIRSIRWLPLVLLMICLFTFNIGLSIVPNTLTGEMYSPPLRTTGSSLSMTLAWSVALAIGSSSDHIVASLRNHGVFWLYSGINAVGFVFTMFVVPETKGMTLVDIGCLMER